MQSDNKYTIFVVGSKPDAIFPDTKPDIIISANSAIKRVQHFFPSTKLCAIMSDQIFSDNIVRGEEGCLEDNQNYIKDSKMDTLILLKTLKEKRIVIDINSWLNYNEFLLLHRFNIYKPLLKVISFKDIVSQIYINEDFKSFSKTVYQFIRYGKINPLEISTGMIALLYALENFNYNKIYVVGVGINSKSGYLYTNKGVYNEFHISRDILFIKALIKKNKIKNVKFTDTELKENVEFWKKNNLANKK